MRQKIHKAVEKILRQHASFMMEEDINRLTNLIVKEIMKETFSV
tara:strand:- start:385 stop:516 length:132 start_codon:yes stop_codon:yes gene_type:complete